MYTIEKQTRANGVTTITKTFTVSDKEAKKEIAMLKKYYPIAWDDRRSKGSLAFTTGEKQHIVIYKVKE